LVVVYGFEKEKMVAAIFGIALLISVIYWTYLQYIVGHFMEIAYLVFAIIIPIKVALFLLDQAHDRAGFHRLSQLAKYIMFSGLMYLIVYYFR